MRDHQKKQKMKLGAGALAVSVLVAYFASPKPKDDLNTVSVSEMRCFQQGAYQYRVGDRGLKKFHYPDSGYISELVYGRKRTSDVVIERYAAYRIISHRNLRRASPQDLDKAFRSYVRSRKTMLMVVHRFYGERGLKWMLQQYQSGVDQNIVRRIKQFYFEGRKINKKDSFIQDILLLTEKSEDFIPCLARKANPPK